MKQIAFVFALIIITFSLHCTHRDTGFAISDSVYINTIVPFDSIRIVPIVQAPNPAILHIPQSGIGYAWFIVEGLEDDEWLPLPEMEIIAEDEQGNEIECVSNYMDFDFLTEPIHIHEAGVFGIPIPSNIIGNGTPGAQETITVTTVDDSILAIENQQSIIAQVVPFNYKTSWSYRMYHKGGAGVTAGVVTATGFVGGGSGAKIELNLDGLSLDPVWSKFKIFRRDDLFWGANLELGPPKLINLGADTECSYTASVPYQHEYEFDLDTMDDLEALLAIYLFIEPPIIYGSEALMIGQKTVSILSWIVELLIANSADYNLEITRLSDEVGLDIEGSLSFGTKLIENKSLNMAVGGSLGANCHVGGTRKVSATDGKIFHKLYVSGAYIGSIGPKYLPSKDTSYGMMFPFNFEQSILPTSLEVKFEFSDEWQNENLWISDKLTASLASNSSFLNFFDPALPGNIQDYKASISTNNYTAHMLLLNAADLALQLSLIGGSPVNFLLNNESCRQSFMSFMDAVHQAQTSEDPIQLNYGLDVEDKTAFSLGNEFQIPVYPGIHVVIGGGISATSSLEFGILKGTWVKGLPYMQYEMTDPPIPGITLDEVLTRIWNLVVDRDIYNELANVITAKINFLEISWPLDNGSNLNVELNDIGSKLAILENSIPVEIDTIFCSFWEWNTEPENPALSNTQRDKIKNYTSNLRSFREEVVGMRYGIGGFFEFGPEGYSFQDTTIITIAYADSEVVDIDETTLAVYWEDEFGEWNMVPSLVFPDSNLVRAEISEFTTYTLAPRLPQGSFSLYSDPDSLAADGVSTALITSETLYNNDDTVIEDGALFTVETSRGVIVTADADTSDFGIQVAVSSGIIQFEVKADSIAFPINLSAESVNGFATCDTTLDLFDVSVPYTPILLTAEPEHGAIHLSWEEVTDPDLAGYHLWFDTDQSGPPYNGTASFEGEPSPVSVGLVSERTITGLSDSETYYVAVSAFDISGSESGYSNEVSISPGLQRVEVITAAYDVAGVRISWEPVFGVTSYKIYRSEDPYAELGDMEHIETTSSTSWVDTSGSSKYFYKIVAVGY